MEAQTIASSAPPAVLVVEDDALLSELMTKLLDEAGYRSFTISDHDQIGAAIARHGPRCVILDGEVGRTGLSRSWEDAATIRRAHPSLPVLMFTGDAAALAEERAGTSPRSREAGFAGAVSKPFVIEQFLATLQSAVQAPAPADSEAVAIFPDISGPSAAEWVKTDLFATAVHELKNPLTTLSGQLQLARKYLGRDEARGRRAMDLAMEQVARMIRLMSELQDHLRLESNAMSLEVVAFDLRDAVTEAVARHEHEEQPRLRFHRPDSGVRVRGDLHRIAQILDNLLNNALKYSPAGTPVDVVVTTGSGEAQVRVGDHGVGVPADEQDRLFTPYYRTSRTRAIPGTGLGLNISRRLAEQHRGRLWLESSTDAGSVFAFGLPLAD